MPARTPRRALLIAATVVCLIAIVLLCTWRMHMRDSRTRFKGYVHEFPVDAANHGHPYGTGTLTRAESAAILKEYEERIADDPGNGALISEKIHFAVDYEPAVAVTACRELLEYSPDSEFLMSHLVVAYMRCGTYDKALYYARKCADERANVENLLLLAQVYYETRKLDEAEKCYRQVLDIEPDNQQAKTVLKYIAELRARRP